MDFQTLKNGVKRVDDSAVVLWLLWPQHHWGCLGCLGCFSLPCLGFWNLGLPCVDDLEKKDVAGWPYLSGERVAHCHCLKTLRLENDLGIMPKNLKALMSLPSLCSAASVSALKSLWPSNATSSTNVLVSGGRVVILSQANLLSATDELSVQADDSKTCFPAEINCFVTSSPSDCSYVGFGRTSSVTVARIG